MKPIKIINNLYLGNASTAKDLNLLKLYGIKVIVSLSGNFHYPSEFICLHNHFSDTGQSEIISHLQQCTEFIYQQITKYPILVHCQGGVSRSPTIILAYLVKYTSMSFDESITHLTTCRPSVRFKPHFINQIQQWLKLDI